MTAVLGFASALASQGLQLLSIKPRRGFVPTTGTDQGAVSIIAHATVEESHEDELEMTDQPVEQGAAITDHAYVLPSRLTVVCGWSDSPNNSSLLNSVTGFAASQSPIASALLGAINLADGVLNLVNGSQSAVQAAYDTLLSSWRARTLFDVYTGKRVYQNMLIKGLATTTTKEFENAMLIRIVFRQILMAQTQTVTVPDSSVMANPQQNAATQNMGTTYPVPAPNINVSALP
jgi:hypothetical protein